MPTYSRVETGPIMCPTCGNELEHLCGFLNIQWGKVPAFYTLGSEIRWLKDRNGSVMPPFVYPKRRWWAFLSYGEPWNCGEPQFRDLWVLDEQIETWPEWARICEKCVSQYDHVGLLIRDGVIDSVRVF